MASRAPVVGFVALDVAGEPGLPQGRYPAGGGVGSGATGVLVVRIVEGEAGRRRGRRRPRRESEDAAGEVPAGVLATRLLATLDVALEGPDEASSWLAGLRRDREQRDALAAAGLSLIRRGIDAQRAASADATLPEPEPARALAWRVGWATGEQAADARWSEALDLMSAMRGTGALRALRSGGGDVDAQKQVVDVLRGRAAVGPHVLPLLRARADLEGDRPTLAALELESALRLWPDAPVELAETAGELALRAVSSELTDEERERLAHTVRGAIRSARPLVTPADSG